MAFLSTALTVGSLLKKGFDTLQNSNDKKKKEADAFALLQKKKQIPQVGFETPGVVNDPSGTTSLLSTLNAPTGLNIDERTNIGLPPRSINTPISDPLINNDPLQALGVDPTEQIRPETVNNVGGGDLSDLSKANRNLAIGRGLLGTVSMAAELGRKDPDLLTAPTINAARVDSAGPEFLSTATDKINTTTRGLMRQAKALGMDPGQALTATKAMTDSAFKDISAQYAQMNAQAKNLTGQAKAAAEEKTARLKLQIDMYNDQKLAQVAEKSGQALYSGASSLLNTYKDYSQSKFWNAELMGDKEYLKGRGIFDASIAAIVNK